MKKESKINSLLNCVKDIWEEIEVQFYGITGAIFFFIVVYLIFQPPWMKVVFDLFPKSKSS